MAKSWIQSLSNRKLEPRALRPEMVGDVEEIAHSLAGNYRFTRQTWKRYTVAEHCVRGATFDPLFLLHELSETYLPDVAAPLKPHLRVTLPGCSEATISWSELEHQHTHAMLEALGLLRLEPLIHAPSIKALDMSMLAAEKRDLCGPPPEDWPGLESVTPAAVRIDRPWLPRRAAREFLDCFERCKYRFLASAA